MTDDGTVKLFRGTFRGNETFFVKHQAPFELREGKLKARWSGFAKYTAHDPPPEDSGYEMGELARASLEHYAAHLNGGDGLAISPLLDTADKRNVCFYAAIDIDVYGVNFTWLVRRLYQAGLKFAAFLSKSGGLHIYFFFSEAEQGDKVIEALNRVVNVFGIAKIFTNAKNKSKVEVFPKQATFVQGERNANCLLLPFYNVGSKSCTTKMLTAEGKLLGIAKALPAVGEMFTSVGAINKVLDELPYGDAPYCIQMILTSGVLAENDGRNNFLFMAAIYLKKKYKEDFYDALVEVNNCLESPLEEREVESTYKSVTTRGYDKFACSKAPCCDYCDKGLCAQREFSPNKRHGNRFTGTYCWGELSKVMAEEPYYLWTVCIEQGEEYKTFRVDSVDDLQNQAVIQKRCWRDLNWAPFTVKTNDWVVVVNKAMEGIENRMIEIPKETDTSAMSALRAAFMRYLTHKQARRGQSYMVHLGRFITKTASVTSPQKGFWIFYRRSGLHHAVSIYGSSLSPTAATRGNLFTRAARERSGLLNAGRSRTTKSFWK